MKRSCGNGSLSPDPGSPHFLPGESTDTYARSATGKFTIHKNARDLALFQLAHRSQDLVAEDDVTMATNRQILEMQEQLNELRQAIANDIADRFEASERRLRKGLSEDLDTKLDARERRLREGLSNDMATKVEASERRLGERLSQVVARQLETAQQHLENRMQVHAESLKDLVTKAAEGYGGTLDGIQRELKDFRAEWRKQTEDTDKVMANHGGRIEAIEKTMSSS